MELYGTMCLSTSNRLGVAFMAGINQGKTDHIQICLHSGTSVLCLYMMIFYTFCQCHHHIRSVGERRFALWIYQLRTYVQTLRIDYYRYTQSNQYGRQDTYYLAVVALLQWEVDKIKEITEKLSGFMVFRRKEY